MRTPFIAGNWKMNKVRDEALNFVYAVNEEVPESTEIETAIFCQAMHLRCMVKRQGKNLRIGAQNIHFEEKGAFTGELSPLSVKDIGVTYALIGHSERRQMFNETDETVNKKIHAAFKYGLKPLMCCGENLAQREEGITMEFVCSQVRNGFKDLTPLQAEKVVIAYEPIWAIGTGKTATSSQAQEVCHEIREEIRNLYSDEVAEKIRIQYGGSVKPANIKEIMAQPDIDGALVGGASLEADSFLKMINELR